VEVDMEIAVVGLPLVDAQPLVHVKNRTSCHSGRLVSQGAGSNPAVPNKASGRARVGYGQWVFTQIVLVQINEKEVKIMSESGKLKRQCDYKGCENEGVYGQPDYTDSLADALPINTQWIRGSRWCEEHKHPGDYLVAESDWVI